MRRVVVPAAICLLLSAGLLWARSTNFQTAASASPSGSAGGDLTGSYPNPTIASGAVTSAKIDTGAVSADKLAAAASVQAQPADPSGTTDTTGKMMGLAGSITPTFSGSVLLIVSGDVTNDTITDGAKVQLSYGTGTAPANGDAIGGTQCGGRPSYDAAGAADRVPFSVNCVVTGLTLTTTYWIDLTLAAITGGTASVSNVSISAVELR